MILSKVEARKKTGEGAGSGKLLKEIETISKALYLDKSPSQNSVSTAKSRSKTTGKTNLPDSKSKAKTSSENPSRKDKKSIWNWKPFKVFSQIGNQRFNCRFRLQVHMIEGLPSKFNDASICVYWKTRDGVLETRPAKIVQGVAEFEDKLTYTCSVYGRRSAPNHSAKYEEKHFWLYASIPRAPEVDLGKHRVDFTRLLPLTLEELEEERGSGEWTTSFRLSGMAKGAVMSVSFGYMVLGNNTSGTKGNHSAPNLLTLRQNSMGLMKLNFSPTQDDGNRSMRRVVSLPSYSNRYSSRAVDEVKDLHDVFPTSRSALASPIEILHQKFDEENTCSPVHDKPEVDALTENLGPTKRDAYPLSDPGKEKSEKCAGHEEKTCSPVHGKAELDVFQVNLGPIEKDGHDLSDSGMENPEKCEANEFSVFDQCIGLSSIKPANTKGSMIKASDDASAVDGTYALDTWGIQVSSECFVEHNSLNEGNDSSKENAVAHESANKDHGLCAKEMFVQELQLALNSISDMETVAVDSPKDENCMEAESEYQMRKSHSMDDVTEAVASEFLNMLGIDHSPLRMSSGSEPESPGERLLRKFEKETMAEGFSLFDFDMRGEDEADAHNASIGPEQWNFSEDLKSSSLLQDLQEGDQVESQEARSKQRAQILEGLETETLMHEWGLNEKAFQYSPPKDSAGFGSPIHLLPEEPLTLPPLAEGLGPFLQTKGGGFLRSMNPLLFRNAKSSGSLIMQVSNPVVVPAEMGSGIMEILQCLASVGIEKLSMQANKLMPLEDISGKTMQQVAWEVMPVLEGTKRQYLLQNDMVAGQDTSLRRGIKGTSSELKSNTFSSSSPSNQAGSDFVSLEDLAPLAMYKIEALSMEGLRIQSGMSDEDAPSNIVAQCIGDISALEGKGGDIKVPPGLDGAAGLQLLDIKDSGGSVDGLMGLSLTLDEWMRLDSGEIDDIDNISEHTSKLLEAHHANSFDLIRRSSKGERKRGKGPGRTCGLLGNNFTAALMVQLRDPLRNYETVGTPMLALIQVERVFDPPNPKIYCKVSEVKNNNDEDDQCEIAAKKQMKDDKKEEKFSEGECIPQFKITVVHVAGLKPEPRKKKLWVASSQQQSGSRWLIANGMGKSSKHPLMKSNAASKSSASVTTNVEPGDTLWSISSRIYSTELKWKDLAALNPHIRNPNVIIPNETIRLR